MSANIMLLLLSNTATEHINKLLLSPMITIKYFKMKPRDAIKLMDSRRNIKATGCYSVKAYLMVV